MSHPYSDLPPEAFWKTGVASPSEGVLTQVWQPRYAVEKIHQIVTFGSCFAQHISRELVAGGYSWINAELAPTFNRSDYGPE